MEGEYQLTGCNSCRLYMTYDDPDVWAPNVIISGHIGIHVKILHTYTSLMLSNSMTFHGYQCVLQREYLERKVQMTAPPVVTITDTRFFYKNV